MKTPTEVESLRVRLAAQDMAKRGTVARLEKARTDLRALEDEIIACRNGKTPEQIATNYRKLAERIFHTRRTRDDR